MAYAVLVSLAETIDKILHHQDQYPISLHHQQQIISIHEYVIFLQAFLEDFPEKANNLEGRITDIANEAENIIEGFMLEQIQPYDISKSTAGRHKAGRMFMCLKRPKENDMSEKLRPHIDLEELKKVADEIDSIAGDAIEIKNRVRNIHQQISHSFVAPSSSSSSSRLAPTSKDAMIGFNDHLLEIKARLCGESSKLQIIPIVGMGGIGKTTLARNAYDDPLIVEHFQIRAWVTVSQDYSAQEILSSLIVSLKAERTGKKDETMQELVYKSLKGRKYLIVMDDMWSTKAWDDVRMILPNDNNGSRIMLTTRLSVVAAYPDSFSPLYEMRFMDEDESWKLLQQKVLAQKSYCPTELETIGKTIARSCRGLPLAIVVIAGVLSTVSKTRASWENIARNVNLAVATNDEQFAKRVVSLSYNHLPQHLRSCFLYMGGFPEDYEIHVSQLVKLWVAEDFLKPSRCGSISSFEEGAEEYLEDLVKRSLVLVIKRKTNGKIKSCSIHDLVRDLCIRKAQEEKFRLNVNNGKILLQSIQNQRRISIAHSSDVDFLEKIDGSIIRTVVCFQYSGFLSGSIGNFRLLRVLEIIRFHAQTYLLVPQVFELFHLRYLAFTYFKNIPADIYKLQNLQTLIIYPIRRSSRSCVNLPMEIWRMPQLRHLVSSYFGCLSDPEGETFPLENLQTLSEVTDFICTKRILRYIPNIKKLGICYSGYEYIQDYCLDNLVHLHQLEKLKLNIYGSYHIGRDLCLTFPTRLKKLTLSGWQIPWKDMNVIGSLPNLEVLKLRDYACVGDKWETSEGEFLEMKFLLIDESDLRHWITECSHFPSLKCLFLYRCWSLSEIPDGIGEIPTLELIEVDSRNKSLVDSAKWIQEEQQSWGNDALHVSVQG